MKRVFRHVILAVDFLLFSAAVRAGFQDGLEAYDSRLYMIAFKEFKPLAVAGDVQAQYYLDLMYG